MANKKILLGVLFLLPLYGDLSIGQMETMVEKIKAKRVGTGLEKDSEFVSPFVMIRKKKGQKVMGQPKRADTVFVLGAIVNDKAFLNHKWLKIGDSIGGYMLTDINDKSVTLVQGDRTIHIFMRKSKTILQLNKG